jgi:hypothetical protein|tara:strand:- start:11086 stop:11364 length:279 start_codon:yes stop_codon:yes gene_type:complete
MTTEQMKNIIKEEYHKIQQDLYQEMLDERAFEAKCKDLPERIEEEEELEEISAVSTGSVQGTAGNNNDEESLIREEDLVEKIMNMLLQKENK